MKYAILALLVVVCVVVLPTSNGQELFMTHNQCKMTQNDCPGRKGERKCNRCCRSAGCNRGDCNNRNCKCKGCPRG